MTREPCSPTRLARRPADVALRLTPRHTRSQTTRWLACEQGSIPAWLTVVVSADIADAEAKLLNHHSEIIIIGSRYLMISRSSGHVVPTPLPKKPGSSHVHDFWNSTFSAKGPRGSRPREPASCTIGAEWRKERDRGVGFRRFERMKWKWGISSGDTIA